VGSLMALGEIIDTVAFLSALGAGLVAGIFFAFSSFVMKALGRLPRDQGIRAMQLINVTVLNPWFFSAFFGTALGATVLTVFGFLHWGNPGAGSLMAGGLLYLAGCIFVTIALNVPLNNALAEIDPLSADGARVWEEYLSRWTAWNHIRTLMSFVSAALVTMALV
jgi:uncharacterized membrane protein